MQKVGETRWRRSADEDPSRGRGKEEGVAGRFGAVCSPSCRPSCAPRAYVRSKVTGKNERRFASIIADSPRSSPSHTSRACASQSRPATAMGDLFLGQASRRTNINLGGINTQQVDLVQQARREREQREQLRKSDKASLKIQVRPSSFPVLQQRTLRHLGSPPLLARLARPSFTVHR